MRAEFGEYQHGGIWSPDATLSLTDPNPTAEEIAAIREQVRVQTADDCKGHMDCEGYIQRVQGV